MHRLLLIFALLVPEAAAAQTAAIDGTRISFVAVAEGLDRPLFVASPPGDARLFIVEQGGLIRILKDGAFVPSPFLDVRDRISAGGERGLLGLAFHPRYADNGRFFVNYTDAAGDTQVVAYTVSTDPDRADPESAATVLTVDQPAGNHNGGWIDFGPDGFLYVALGDGGGAGDRSGNGQNPDVLLGKVLRLDVDGAAPYAIPADNPFADGGGAPEIFLLGVRNPWRNSFDGEDLYIADVGQQRFEEITVVDVATAAGANLGWNVMEGTACFVPRQNCDPNGLTWPHYAYPREDGCTVIGGYVYRGTAIPEMAGRYFFADYCLGTVGSFRYADGTVADFVEITEETGRLGRITSFGVDAAGEIYVIHGDKVAKIVPAS